jgi:hypothetical protein
MSSPLDLVNSEAFRKKLVVRNLVPYAKSPSRPSPPINYEYIQSDTSVIDSPDQLIDQPSFANKLYPLNEWGAEGGYKQVPDPNGLLNTVSNRGEYGPGQQDANIIDQGIAEAKNWKKVNAYSNGTESIADAGEFISNQDQIGAIGQLQLYNNQPYPTTFNPSSYAPIGILLSPDPQGSNGLLSQDSFIARLGAQTLRREFENRIAAQIKQDTLGRANVLNVTSGTDLVNILSGVVPIIEPNFTITVTANPVLAATNFALRLGGSILPVSPIPGSYFDPNVNPGPQTTIQQMSNAFRRSGVGRFVNRLMGGGDTGSQIMFNNMGAGQRSRLFKNIDYNKYKPNFPRNFFDRVGGVLTGTQSNNSNFYVGNITSNPSQIFSPAGAVPVDGYGIEQQSPVYGPTELAQLYEGPSREIRLGANGPTYSNGGGIEGGFTWVSPKYKDNAGFTVGVGGVIVNQDENFRPSSYVSTESTNFEFRDGSILDKTQRIIDSQPQGAKRLQHAGNAIDQVSKVFSDGYQEMTKGSRVISYTGEIGQEVGTEYCRVFAKDIPYLQYNNLQKVDGITTNGRRFSNSVLDNTYNLNIYPNKQEGGQSSTNLINAPGGLSTNVGYAKKYMFSIENLAWRTSNTPGFTSNDLALCERGPNGGRVMWFPPYGLTFSENVSANWNTSEFLGRPEPVYTYKNTSRGGTLTWKIVVDHPSILNSIVDKVLGNETNKTRINSILDSFFAGCRKYDIYELAKKYYTINPNDLYLLQTAITSKDLTREELIATKQTIQTGYNAPTTDSTPVKQDSASTDYWQKYIQLGLYFPNDYPKKPTATAPEIPAYPEEYSIYNGQKNTYVNKSTSTNNMKEFYDTVVETNYEAMQALITDIKTKMSQNSKGNLTINLNASCSAPQTIAYNKELASRRIVSAKKYLESQLSDLIKSKRLSIVEPKDTSESPLGEQTSVPKALKVVDGKVLKEDIKIKGNFNCSDNDTGQASRNVRGGDTTVGAKDEFTVGAMACRRAFISSITSTLNQPETTETPDYVTVTTEQIVTRTTKVPTLERTYRQRDNITKFVLRQFLSECDYFETIKEQSPMVYDNLREKLKFFQPAFHSMTPEGLNTRLTFLQQCMRPGDTIPTVREIGGTPVLQYNNATNTSFGAPPVLILRVGDFYNTKIIPSSLSFQYEDLDINPEGIGVQPMIANVTLQFNFVGGSGLKESIDKLQNALTFNYYANTEIYDDRADVTARESFLDALDKEFLGQSVPPSPPALNQAVPNAGQNNNSTIGSILNTNTTGTIETGEISYTKFMDDAIVSTQTYFTNIINRNREVLSQYNNAMRQEWMMSRDYFSGNLIEQNPIEIFGKPSNIQQRVDVIFDTLTKNVADGTDSFIRFISATEKNFTPRLVKTVQENYANFLKDKKSSYLTPIFKTVQDLTNVEQSYIQTLARMNLIGFDGLSQSTKAGTDGLQVKSGPVKIYIISGATTENQNVLPVMVADIKTLRDDVAIFNTLTLETSSFIYTGDNQKYESKLVLPIQKSNGSLDTNSVGGTLTTESVFIPFSNTTDFNDYNFRRQYMILSNDVIDAKKYETFKKAMIGNIIGNTAISKGGFDNTLEEQFDAYWLGKAKPQFVTENNIAKEFIDNLEKDKLKKYMVYKPFESKTRVLNYTTDTSDESAVTVVAQQTMIKGLGATTNINTNTPTLWNNLVGSVFGTYVSKAKLN